MLAGALTTGMTVTDLREPADASCHTQVATTLDNAGFWCLVTDALKNLLAPLRFARNPTFSHVIALEPPV